MNGNWTWVRKGCRIVDEKGRKVAEVSVSHCDEAELNRRGQAMAAVPEMIAALEAALPLLEGFEDSDIFEDGEEPVVSPIIKQVRAALSRALTPEGE